MLTLQQTEQLVAKYNNMFWDGWNLVIVNPRIDGFTKISGIFHDGKWGVKRVVSPDRKGYYDIPKRYLDVQRTT